MSLDRAAIVAAALELLDEVGIDGLSTRKLADKLGIRGPSLYWHFKSKRELLDHMAEAILHSALPPLPQSRMSSSERTAWLGASARAIRDVALTRRDGAHVLAGARPTGSCGPLSFAAMVSAMEQSGLGRSDSLAVLQVLGRYAIGWVLYEQSTEPDRAGPSSEASFEFGLRALLQGIEDRLKTGAPVAHLVAIPA